MRVNVHLPSRISSRHPSEFSSQIAVTELHGRKLKFTEREKLQFTVLSYMGKTVTYVRLMLVNVRLKQ